MKNALAQKHLRQVKKGDRIFYYHTGDEKSVVAVAKAVTDADPPTRRTDPASSPPWTSPRSRNSRVP